MRARILLLLTTLFVLVATTVEGENHPYGVKFESCLPLLCEMVKPFGED